MNPAATDALRVELEDVARVAIKRIVIALDVWSSASQERQPALPAADQTGPSHRYWFTTAQAAEYAALDPETVARACRSGVLKAGQPSGLVKGHWRIHRDDLDAWLGRAT